MVNVRRLLSSGILTVVTLFSLSSALAAGSSLRQEQLQQLRQEPEQLRQQQEQQLRQLRQQQRRQRCYMSNRKSNNPRLESSRSNATI